MPIDASRQPILDRDLNLYAYEILFKNGSEQFLQSMEDDYNAANPIANSGIEYALSELTAGNLAHINFDYKSIVKQHPSMLAANKVSIEIVNIDKPGKRLLQEGITLKEAGYKIVLDSYIHQRSWIHFFPYVQMIKLDMLTATDQYIRQAVKIKQKFPHIKLAAKKIESDESFQLVKEAGFDYFQGYFFAKPQQATEKSVGSSNYALAELLFEISNEDLDLEKVIDTFQTDIGLTYKLLRYSNSTAFKKQIEITSLKQAIVSLGKIELLKFVTVLFAAKATQNKSVELVTMALIRAKMCEGLALEHGDNNPATAFLVGMLSLIDVILDEPLAEVIKKLKLGNEIIDPLINEKGYLYHYIKLIQCYENGHWDDLSAIAETVGIESKVISATYSASVYWVNDKIEYMN